ncbi:MAG: pimeloyl-ACP methyl ester esterase BioH [Thiobacillaceae bacterium]
MTDLVLIHGWGTHPVIWDPLIANLPSKWKVHNLPLPGYAGTASGAQYGLDDLAEALLPQLPDDAMLVGWSLGGLVAMHIAYRWPEKLRGLALIGATPCFVTRPDWPHAVAPDVFDGFAESLAQNYAETLRRFLGLQAQGSASMRVVLREMRTRLISLPRPSDKVLRAGLEILQKSDLRSSLPFLPINVVHGSGDRLAPIEAARWLTQRSKTARLLEIRGAGHAPFLSHPVEVAAFLAEAADV